MTKAKPSFDDKEGGILNAMYEASNGVYDTYALAGILDQDVKINSPAGEKVFNETRDAIERLIEQGLVHGIRLMGGMGVYFTELKLTYKGEQSAIRYRRERKEVQAALKDVVAELKEDSTS